AEDGIRDATVTGVQTCALPIFSPMEIVYGVELTGMTLRDYLSMLRDNGLGTLPGTAAEILDDEVRHVLSRNKLSTAQWQEVIRRSEERRVGKRCKWPEETGRLK